MSTDEPDQDFSDYVESTIDPGWLWTVSITVLCFLINLSVPCLVRLGKRRDLRLEEKQVIIDIPGHIDTMSSEHSSVAPAPGAGTKATNADVSLSGISTTSSAMLSHFSAVLDVPHHPSKKGRMRFADNKDRLHARLQLENDLKDSDEFHEQDHKDERVATSPKSLLGMMDHDQDQDEGEQHPNNSKAAPTSPNSLLGMRDQDQVSVNDAIDAQPSVHNMIANEASSSPRQKPSKEVVPLYGKKHIMNGLDKLIDIADWDKEMKRVWWLAKPFTIQSFVDSVLGIVELSLIGHILGAQSANAYVIVGILSELTNTINYGFLECLGVLIPQADGAGNTQLIGQYWQLCTGFYTLGAFPIIILWSFLAEPAVLWFGFDEETARIGQGFAYSFTIFEWVGGFQDPLHTYLDCFDHEYYSTVVVVLESLVHVAMVVVVPAAGYKDLVVIGFVQLGVSVIISACTFAHVTHKGWLDDIWEGLFHTNAFKNRKAIKNVIEQAIPLSFSYILIYGEWELMTIFASFMGPAEVAVWGMIGFLWEAFENITEGLAEAAEVRISYHMGNGRPDRAKSCAYKCILLGFQIAVFSTGLLYILAEYIPKWITPDPTLQKLMFDVIPLIGIGQMAMNLGILSWSVIGAQGRYRLATGIEFVASWFVVMPMSAIVVYKLRFNLQGLVGAVVLGYALSGATNLYIVLRSDWKKLSDIVVAKHEAEESSSSSSSSSSASAEDDEGSMTDPQSNASSDDTSLKRNKSGASVQVDHSGTLKEILHEADKRRVSVSSF